MAMKEICKPNASYIITGSIYKKTSKQEVKDAYTVIGALNFVGAFFFGGHISNHKSRWK